MQILAAPIQEYTDAAFRNAHSRTIGGIDEYYMPFIRLEKGALTRRSENDIAPENNNGTAVVPQILVQDGAETATLLATLSGLGYRRVDFNFGCPFPKVVKAGYGAGMLGNPAAIREVLSVAAADGRFRVSVKLRLGIHDKDAWRTVLPVLGDFPLDKIVLHARTAEQQYDGEADREAFEQFCMQCRQTVVFNGDIRRPEDAAGLDAVMIGRGLLANPLLPWQLCGEQPPPSLLGDFHKAYVDECRRLYQQPLLKLKIFWDYFLPDADKHIRKAVQKARTMEEYAAAAARCFGEG